MIVVLVAVLVVTAVVMPGDQQLLSWVALVLALGNLAVVFSKRGRR